jgi:hypothetical protein
MFGAMLAAMHEDPPVSATGTACHAMIVSR